MKSFDVRCIDSSETTNYFYLIFVGRLLIFSCLVHHISFKFFSLFSVYVTHSVLDVTVS